MGVKVFHLGIIPDGGRRWAKENKKSLYESYSLSMAKLAEIIATSFKLGVGIQSIYYLSKENLNRQDYELDAVYTAELDLCTNLLPNICRQWECQVQVAGLLNLLPEKYRNGLVNLVAYTESYKSKKLNLLVAYNPWDEINSAVIASKQMGNIQDYLWVKDDVDLVIRSGAGAAKLISNFLPLQSGYAEFVFLEKNFNDIDVSDVIRIIEEFPLSGKRLIGK